MLFLSMAMVGQFVSRGVSRLWVVSAPKQMLPEPDVLMLSKAEVSL